MIEPSSTRIQMDTTLHELAEPFRIAGQVHDDVLTLTVTLSRGGTTGRGECNPYSVRGHDLDSVQAAITEMVPLLQLGASRTAILETMAPGPARNAVDCALVDLECKERNVSTNQLLGIEASSAISTAQTIGLGTEGGDGLLARFGNYPTLKLKIDRVTPVRVLAQLREIAPESILIVDANGSLDLEALRVWLPELERQEVRALEQPVAVGQDELLQQLDRGAVRICADESFLSLQDLPKMIDHYDMVNVKLDKIGGVTAGLEAIRLAHHAGLEVLVGCMLGTSLSAAPAWWLANEADLVDIDGPTMLLQDIADSMTWQNGFVNEPRTELWGNANRSY